MPQVVIRQPAVAYRQPPAAAAAQQEQTHLFQRQQQQLCTEGADMHLAQEPLSPFALYSQHLVQMEQEAAVAVAPTAAAAAKAAAQEAHAAASFVAPPAEMADGSPTAHFTREDVRMLSELLPLPSVAQPDGGSSGTLRMLRRSRSMELPNDLLIGSGRGSRPSSPALHRLERATPLKARGPVPPPAGLAAMLGLRSGFGRARVGNACGITAPVSSDGTALRVELYTGSGNCHIPASEHLPNTLHDHYLQQQQQQLNTSPLSGTGEGREAARRRLTSNQSDASHLVLGAGASPSSAAFAAAQVAQTPPTTAGLHGIGQQLDLLLADRGAAASRGHGGSNTTFGCSDSSPSPTAPLHSLFTPHGSSGAACQAGVGGTHSGSARSQLFSPGAGLLFATSPGGRPTVSLFSPGYKIPNLFSPGAGFI